MREHKFKIVDKNNQVRGPYSLEDLCYERRFLVWENIIAFPEFTGLKDKNGVDIYEGDILETYPNQEEYDRGLVVFEDGAFAIKDKDNLNSLDYRHFEVVGNIYENPELLGGQDERD